MLLFAITTANLKFGFSVPLHCILYDIVMSYYTTVVSYGCVIHLVDTLSTISVIMFGSSFVFQN